MRLALVAAGFAACLVVAAPAQAAAPRILIISGKPLRHQVVISDWPNIATITRSSPGMRPTPRRQLADRPHMTISMFWGPQWSDYLRSGKPATALRPKQADQVGRFYPAWRGRPAVLDLPWAGWPQRATAKALAILHRSGVPTNTP